MKKKYRITKRFVSLLVVLALVVTLVPAAVLAQDAPTMESAAVTVDAIPEGMDVIPVPFGTAQDAIPFPLLTAGGVSLSDVKWEADTYDTQTPGDYVFTAALPEGYMPPDGQAKLSVTVTVAQPQGTTGETIQANAEAPSTAQEETATELTSPPPNDITPPALETAPVVVAAFDAFDPAAYEIAVGGELPALPDSLAATDADGEALTIEGVTWEAEGFDANTPGDYVFTAKLPEGYEAAPETGAPQITVTVAEPPLSVSAFGAEETVTVISVYLGDDKWDMPVYYALDGIHSAADLGLPDSIVGKNEKNQRIEITGVTWECAAFNTDAPGTYTFRLVLPTGYAAAGETFTITVVLYNEFAANGLQYWILTEAPERTAVLAGWAGAPQASLKVPATVSNGGGSYRVTEVAPHAFEADGAIKNLYLSGADNLTEIGAYAFAHCDNINNILTIPANVVRIGACAFMGARFSALNLQGAARLTTIGIMAFNSLKIKGEVTIPGGVTTIGSLAFENCEYLEMLDLSAFRGTLGKYVFLNCRSLSTVIFGQAEAPELPDNTFEDAGLSGGSIHCPKGATGYEKVLGLFPDGWSLDYLDIHAVTVNDAVGGTGLVASGAASGAGGKVILVARPQSGYGFVRWDTEPAVTWLDGTNQYDAGAFFSMPDRDVVVTPVFSLMYGLSGTVSANGRPTPGGLQVTLYNAAGKRVGSAATNADGKYTFSGLTAGTYQVTVMGATISDIPYYQTTREFELTDRDKTDADVTLETGVTQVGFVSAKANGTQNLDTSTQIDLRFDVPVPLTKDCVTLKFNDGGAADVFRLVDEGQSKTDWVLEIGNVVTPANKGYVGGSVTIALPEGYQFTGGALGNLKLINLCRQLEPPVITAASYDTDEPVVGGAITVTPGTYTANEAGAAGEHRYTWYRSDRETGLGTPVARTRDYTPTGEDFGKYIWVETTPRGEITNFGGRPVASPRLQVGVKLTVTITGAACGTSPTIDGTAAGGGVVIYGPVTVSFTKTAAGDTVKWTASPNEGSFDDDTAATAVYTPAAQPSAGTIALTATLTVNAKDQDQPAPAPFELAYTANGETDYTVTIPEIAGAEYSFDGTTFGAERSKTGCKPGETVTGYARLAAKPGYNAGAVTGANVTLPLLDVHTPTISPSGGTFTGAQSVTLSCTTAGADIYYTLDGNTPNAGSTRYTGTFTLTKTATVKAIAVKAGMADSIVASASFTRATDDLTPVDLTKDATFTLNGDFALIGRVLLDGKEMGQVNKTPTSADLTWAGYPGNAGKLEKGSVIVTLYKEFLKTLPEGRYTLTVEFNDAGGSVSTGDLQFAVPKQQEPKPTATGGGSAKTGDGSAKTGDESNMALWIVLVCVAGFAVYRKRKYRNQ